MNKMINKIQFFRDPYYFIFLIQLLLVFILYLGLGHLNFQYGLSGDDDSYLALNLRDISAVLGGYRTLGYPIFLKVYKLIDSDFTTLPYFCFLLFSFSLIVLYSSLSKVYSSKLIPFIFCSAIFWNMEIQLFRFVLTESIAYSILILTLALMVNIGHSGLKYFVVFALSLLVFISWNVRPTFVVLVFAVPIAVFLLKLMNLAKFSYTRFIVLVSLIIVPMIFFIAIRYHLTGHIGITSFNGFGFGSHATTHLVSDDLRLVNGDTQKLARDIYSRKQFLQEGCETDSTLLSGQMLFDKKMKCANDYGMITWLAAIEDTNGKKPIPHLPFIADPWNFQNELKLGSLSTFFTENHSVAVENKMLEFSTMVIQMHFREYLRWIKYSLINFLENLIPPMMPVILLFSIIFGFWPKNWINIYQDSARSDITNYIWLASCSILYYVISYVLTIITYIPLGRYNDLHGLFWRSSLFLMPIVIGLYIRNSVVDFKK